MSLACSTHVFSPTPTPTPSASDSETREGSIRINYHTKSGRVPEEISPEEYRARMVSQAKAKREHDRAPWYPFNTRSDFELAQLMLKSSLSQADISRVLTLIQRCTEKEDELTFKQYSNIADSWKAAANLVTPVCYKCCIPHFV